MTGQIGLAWYWSGIRLRTFGIVRGNLLALRSGMQMSRTGGLDEFMELPTPGARLLRFPIGASERCDDGLVVCSVDTGFI